MRVSPLERFAVAVLERIGTLLWGFPPRLMAPIVQELGPLRALWWFGRHLPRYELTLRRFGKVRTHLICVAISLVNGCRYCAHGHAYALQLAHLNDVGTLFPLDNQAIDRLRGLPAAHIRNTLVDALERTRLHAEMIPLDRTFALMAGVYPPIDRDDVQIAHLVAMFGMLNSVGVADQTPIDEAHDPLNRDPELKRSYAVLHAALSV